MRLVKRHLYLWFSTPCDLYKDQIHFLLFKKEWGLIDLVYYAGLSSFLIIWLAEKWVEELQQLQQIYVHVMVIEPQCTYELQLNHMKPVEHYNYIIVIYCDLGGTCSRFLLSNGPVNLIGWSAKLHFDPSSASQFI